MSSTVNENPSIRQERRDYERVQDAVGLELQLLVNLPAAGEGPAQVAAPERVQVRVKNKYDIDGYGEVKRDFPAVAKYIDDLEERIRTLLLRGDSPAEVPTHKVSLSGSGMAFADDTLLQPGDIIGIKLTLFPSLARISCDATVISVGDAQEVGVGDRHTYRAIFNRITDQDRKLIDTHVKNVRRGIPNEGE